MKLKNDLVDELLFIFSAQIKALALTGGKLELSDESKKRYFLGIERLEDKTLKIVMIAKNALKK